MQTTIAGTCPAGEPVHRIKLEGGGLTAIVFTWGSVIQSLYLQGHQHPLVLGFAQFDHYPVHSPYFGATAGRYANRIAQGKFTIDNNAYQADQNFLGKHTLHGGSHGIGTRNWSIADLDPCSVRLEISDADGSMGFPGNCNIACTYTLQGHGELDIRYEAVCDQTTLCNLAHHSYFNLDGSDGILDHQLSIAADHYLPVDNEMIPTGEIESVDGTAFDFRHLRPIRYAVDGEQLRYDHNYCLSTTHEPTAIAAKALSLRSGLTMEVVTTEPGVQLYAGHGINTKVAGLSGRQYGPYSGFCLEPQRWPDSPNHPHFPQAVLRPGETYRQHTCYRFFL
jgi:aldose 1-epimerase